MPIRITNAETEQLIHKMAELEQVTPSQAVHKAVSQWLSELNLTSREGKVVEGLVKGRVLIAYMDGRDHESKKIYSDVMGTSLILILILICALVFSAVRLGALTLVIIVSIVSIFAYSRVLTRENEERSKGREKLDKQIDETRNKMPSELRFLSYGPMFMDMF